MKTNRFITFFGILFFTITSVYSYSKIVRTGYINYDNGFMSGISEIDAKDGYGYEYLRRVSNITDWKYDYTYGDWTTLYNMFLNGELDVLTDVSYSEERAASMYFPSYVMGEEDYYIYVLPENQDITYENIESLNKKIIGAERNAICTQYLEKWIKENNISCFIRYYDNVDALQRDFLRQIVDCVVDVDMNNIFDWIPAFKVGASDFYMAVNKDRKDLQQELESALQELYIQHPFLNHELHEKYLSNTFKLKQLKDQEKEFFEKFPYIRVGCINDFLPFCSIDITNGNPTGLMPVLMERMIRDLGLSDKIQLQYMFYSNITDGLEALDRNEIDLFFPVNDSLWNAEMYDYYQTQPFTYSSEKLLYKGIFSQEKLDVIAVTNCSPDYFYARLYYPKSEIVLFDSYDSALAAVVQGKVNSAIINGYKTQLYLEGSGKYHNLNMLDLSADCEYAMILPKSNKVLFQFMDRGISMVQRSFIDSTVTYYASRTLQYTFRDFITDYIRYICFGILILLILLFALIFTLDKLHAFSDFDALSHLMTEKKVVPILRTEINHAIETEGFFSIIILEIDGFSTLISSYGNNCCDEIYKYVSNISLRAIKKDDYIFRYKSYKILIIVDARENVANEVIKRIISEVTRETFMYKDNEISLSINYGISAYADGVTAKFMIDEAETQLSEK